MSTFPITLGSPGESAVTVNRKTSDGTGSANYSPCEYAASIYEGNTGTTVFEPGVTLQTVRIPIFNCEKSLTTGIYTFFFSIASQAGGNAVRSSTQIDVVGDAPATTNPGLYVMNAFADNNSGTVDVPVVLGGPSGLAQGVPVTVSSPHPTVRLYREPTTPRKVARSRSPPARPPKIFPCR